MIFVPQINCQPLTGSTQVAPLFMSVIITLFLLTIYGIPVDPNTGEVLSPEPLSSLTVRITMTSRGRGLYSSKTQPRPSPTHIWPSFLDAFPYFSLPKQVFGGGTFFPYRSQAAGYSDEPYPFAAQTSDPSGMGATYGSNLHMIDLSLRYRISLKTRWESPYEWMFWPNGRYVVSALAALHTFFVCISSAIFLWQDLPLGVRGAFDQHARNARIKAERSKLGSAADEGKSNVDVVDEQLLRRKTVLRGKMYIERIPPVPGRVRDCLR